MTIAAKAGGTQPAEASSTELARVSAEALAQSLGLLTETVTRTGRLLDKGPVYVMMTVGVAVIGASLAFAPRSSFTASEFVAGTLTGAAILVAAGVLAVVEAVASGGRVSSRMAETTKAVQRNVHTLFPPAPLPAPEVERSA